MHNEPLEYLPHAEEGVPQAGEQERREEQGDDGPGHELDA